MQQPPPPAAVGDRPVLFDEDSKAVVHADELGENRRQLRAPDGGKEMEMKGAVLPAPNPAQVLPNPAQMPHHRQNDEDRELQGDRPVDYGKRHKAIDIL
ncbi:hypothetical protein AAFF_G00224880 [Aldrovandia affinis]|uniref:Uncharacterized protein n=1 Tax=Aldrovandia affinis TaxID=143900 RepID=A0AAD7X293_9TELE|nr:hypothetical protein AAFF_G00224880 [Aldrovandia affinis]